VLAKAWESIPVQTLRRCWNKLLLPTKTNVHEHEEDDIAQEDDIHTKNIVSTIHGVEDVEDISIKDWLETDRLDEDYEL